MKVALRYLPKTLTRKDRKAQYRMLRNQELFIKRANIIRVSGSCRFHRKNLNS